MRVIGVVSKLGFPAGLYLREAVDKATACKAWSLYTEFESISLASKVWAFLSPQSYFAMRVLEWVLKDKKSKIKRLEEALLPEISSCHLPHPAIYIPSSGLLKKYSDYNDAIFHGLFKDKSLLQNVMESEGGNSELVILDQDLANKTFKHAGAGRFSLGLYCPHPKDVEVLLPIESYSDYLKNELHAEWVSLFESLGAKTIIIADATEVKGEVKTTAVGAAGAIAAEMKAAYGHSNVEESHFSTGVFDPVRAKTARRWLGDHPAVLSIMEGRIQGNQLSWRKSIKVDVSFSASVNLICAAGKGDGEFKATLHRNYDFYVEFYPKAEP